MPLTKISNEDGVAIFVKTEETNFNVNVKDCIISFYHSDDSTPAEVAGWYCQFSHKELGNFEFRLQDKLDSAGVENAVLNIQAMFDAFISSLA